VLGVLRLAFGGHYATARRAGKAERLVEHAEKQRASKMIAIIFDESRDCGEAVIASEAKQSSFTPASKWIASSLRSSR
jgi:hypothetical protein